VDAALALSGLAMGVAASPHCAAMCGAPCAAITGGCKRSVATFQLGRLLGYMAAGAVAAASVGWLATSSQVSQALRPLWVMLHVAALIIGLWWLLSGRTIAATRGERALPVRWVEAGTGVPASLPPVRRRARSALAGLAWVAWPCAATQAALLLAALASSAQGGALTMAAFATGSMPALAAAPWLWSRLPRRHGALVAGLALRAAGLGIVLTSGWALGHGLWRSVAAWCGV
jgi:hypothetical protein